MVECRRFEVRAQELFFEGLVRGTTHLGTGQEAVAAGLYAANSTTLSLSRSRTRT